MARGYGYLITWIGTAVCARGTESDTPVQAVSCGVSVPWQDAQLLPNVERHHPNALGMRW